MKSRISNTGENINDSPPGNGKDKDYESNI